MTKGSLPLIWRKFPERYNLIGTTCRTCGTSYFPGRKICHECRRKGRLVEEAMPKDGVIISYTKVFSGPEGFEKETPYFLAVIELSNKARLLAQIVDRDDTRIAIGSKVEMVFRKISESGSEGPISYGYKFRVVD